MSEFRKNSEFLENLPKRQQSHDVKQSADRLEPLGVHFHFQDLEIETKIKIKKNEKSSEEILIEIKNKLENAGYSFITNEVDRRENYYVFYTNHVKGKIIARNKGESGFQIKQKSKTAYKSEPEIIIKEEYKGPIFNSFEEAEHYLISQMGEYANRENIQSIAKVNKIKLPLAAKGKDSVTRYFLLVVDETEAVNSRIRPSKKLRQIELEYKGSDTEKPDHLKTIQSEMEVIVAKIMKNVNVPTRRTTKSKRAWSKQNTT